jgi:hypothetical protein
LEDLETSLMDNTLLDGELVLDKWKDGLGAPQERYTYLVYDLVACNGKVRRPRVK